MSFRPPQLSQFVRVPPEVRRLRGATRNLVPAGLLALITGALGSIAFAIDWENADGYEKTAIFIAIAALLIGGVLALMKRPVGAPLAVGGTTLFIGSAASLIGANINFHGLLDATEAKLVVAAGAVGLVTAIVGLAGLGGRANATLGVVIAVLAFVPVIAIGALVHIDDLRAASINAVVAGAVIVAIITAVAGLRGTYGALAAVIAAGSQIPTWVQTVKLVDDRKPAGVAALVATSAITALGVVAALLAGQRDAAAAEALERTDTSTAAIDPIAAVAPFGDRVGAPLAGASHVARSGQPIVAPPVPPISAPAVPVPPVTASGRWAPDPYGRFQVRYWNGTKWTEHVSNDGVTALDPMP
jgi:hypothetical protein